MAAERSLALVLRTVDVFESSRVITLFSRDAGKIAVLAKGLRRPRNAMQAGLDLLSVCDIVWLHKASESLGLLTEAVLVESFEAPRRELPALFAGYHVAELLLELVDLHAPLPRLFDAAVVTLRHLEGSEPRPWRLARFELACLRELGQMPSLENCVHCGDPTDPDAQVAFAINAGGVVCQRCEPVVRPTLRLAPEVRRALRALAMPGSTWRDLPRSEIRPVRSILDQVFSHLMGRPPRLHSFLEQG